MNNYLIFANKPTSWGRYDEYSDDYKFEFEQTKEQIIDTMTYCMVANLSLQDDGEVGYDFTILYDGHPVGKQVYQEMLEAATVEAEKRITIANAEKKKLEAEKKLQEEDLSLKHQRATYEVLKKKFETE